MTLNYRITKKVFWSVLGLLMVVGAIFSLWILNQKEKNSILQTNEAVEQPSYEGLLQEVNRSTIEALKLNNHQLPSTPKVEDINGDSVAVKSIAKNGEKLVMQYSELNCDVCVDSTLSYIREFSKKVGTDNVAVIGATENKRYLIQFMHLNQLAPSQMYMIKVKQAALLYDFIPPAPFIYLLDSIGRASDVFFPVKENPSLSEMYFDMVYKKHFSKP